MADAVVVQGRAVSAEVLGELRALAAQPTCTRSALARRLCRSLGWKGADGRWCEMGARKALVALGGRGLVELPAPRRVIPRPPRRIPVDAAAVPAALECSLAELTEVSWVPVRAADRQLSRQWYEMMAAHHDLGAGPLVGAQQRYLLHSDRGWLGAMAFSAPAWRLAPRDGWIGWSDTARRANLHRVVCQSRFLIAPWVRVPNLASKALALAIERLGDDWEAAYGYRPLLVETYVDGARFRASSYRAANWIHVGCTQGRGRQDRACARAVPVKEVYLYPLTQQARERLCREPAGLPPAPAAAPRGDAAPVDWAEEEFGRAPLGDARRTQRLLDLARAFYARPQANLPQACESRARTKAAYRWLAQPDVTLPKILEPHYAATARRAAEHPVVLAVQDSTSLNYSTHPATQGLGPIINQGKAQGLRMHDTLALTPEGLPLGLVDVQVWARDLSEYGKRHQSAKRPIEEKESIKWLRSFEAAERVQAQCPETTVVSVGDREADVYDLLARAQRPGAPKLLVRAQYPRKLKKPDPDVWTKLEGQPCAGTYVVQVPPRAGRRARLAELEVRFASVTLPPARRRRKLGAAHVWAILAREREAPEETKPIEWRLYTTVEVETFEQALERLRWYTHRWWIEVYHRTLKTGCRIEHRQLATAARLENCLAIDLVVAWRVMHLTKLGRETPDLPCTVFFEDHQWKALCAFVNRRAGRAAQPPAEPPTIRDAMRTVASLGGFLGRKSDGDPGAQTLWLGLQRLDDIAAAWLAFHPDASPAPPVPNRLDSG